MGGISALLARRGVLLIAHDYPPASGSGSQRALAFSRYLPLYGWRPSVLTVEAAWSAHPDEALLRQVPPHARLLRTASFEPRFRGAPALAGGADAPVDPRPPPAWKQHLGHARRFPDAHRGWLPFAVAAGLRALAGRRIQVLYSSSGPFTSHLVGLILHRLTGVPWIAELRDGWYRWNQAIFPDYPRWRGPVERALEGAVVHGANRVVLVTELMARAFRQQYADRLFADHFRVISNGFDPAQYPPAPRAPDGHPRFLIVHAGAIYYGRGAGPFLRAFAQVADAIPAFRALARLELVGSLDERSRRELEDIAAAGGVRELVTLRGQLTHAASLAAQQRADLLLLLANTTAGAEATVPGKLFEYLAAGRTILVLGPEHSASAEILAETGAGWAAPADDIPSIAARLTAAFSAHQAGHLPAPNATAVRRYDRRVLTGQLAGLLDEVVSERTRRP